MKFKMFGSFALALICALILPFSSASAGAGEWDPLGTKYFSYSSALGMYKTDYVKSGGGDFKVCVRDSGGYTNMYHLYEYDPGSGNDDYVGYAFIESNGCFTFSNIGKYVDGDNNKAEFYVAAEHTAFGTPVSAWYYD